MRETYGRATAETDRHTIDPVCSILILNLDTEKLKKYELVNTFISSQHRDFLFISSSTFREDKVERPSRCCREQRDIHSTSRWERVVPRSLRRQNRTNLI